MGSLGIALALILIYLGVSGANILGDAACKLVYCGQGTCNGSVDVAPFFECDCYPGWTHLQLPGLPILIPPPCLMPNCTVDFNSCGLPPLPPIILPANSSDPCDAVWCANGTCSAAGSGHVCNCDAGAFNLLEIPAMPCFVECFLGSDCKGLGLGPPPPPPAGTSSASGPSPTGAGASAGGRRRWIGAVGYMVFLTILQSVV